MVAATVSVPAACQRKTHVFIKATSVLRTAELLTAGDILCLGPLYWKERLPSFVYKGLGDYWNPTSQLFIHYTLQYIMLLLSSALSFMLACALRVEAVPMSQSIPPAMRRTDVSVVTPMTSTQLASLAPYTEFARAAYCSPGIVTDWQCGRTQFHSA
jgi:hypothetical protein